MLITHLIWLDDIEDKLQWKHGVTTAEVKQVLLGNPRFFFKEEGRVEGEHLYNALGRTEAGRYLSIFFILKRHSALIVSAREMNRKERKHYDKK